jgi:hypothetical protein
MQVTNNWKFFSLVPQFRILNSQAVAVGKVTGRSKTKKAVAAAQHFAKLRHKPNAHAEQELLAILMKLVDAVLACYGK